MAGAGVHLGYLDPVGAGHIAYPAAAAIIHGMIGGRLVSLAEARGLRPGVFWAWEMILYGSHRASRDADIAFDTLIEA